MHQPNPIDAAGLPPAPTTGPYCGACHYPLGGLTDASKCPECGKPLVEVLRWPNQVILGKRWRTQSTILGMPVIDIAFGPSGTDRMGHARGWIALGDDAMGMIAVGGISRGVVALGGMSLGVCSLGGMSAGLLTALGGMALGTGISFGGVAAGAVATGGMAVGGVASGGLAVGYYARGGMAIGTHAISGASRPATALDAWAEIEPVFGAFPASSPFADFSLVAGVGLTVAIAVVLGLVAVFRLGPKRQASGGAGSMSL